MGERFAIAINQLSYASGVIKNPIEKNRWSLPSACKAAPRLQALD
jgi:hypothetical protein